MQAGSLSVPSMYAGLATMYRIKNRVAISEPGLPTMRTGWSTILTGWTNFLKGSPIRWSLLSWEYVSIYRLASLNEQGGAL